VLEASEKLVPRQLALQREIDRLYQSMKDLGAHGLVGPGCGAGEMGLRGFLTQGVLLAAAQTDPACETPEEAVFGVYLMLGDLRLADAWLAQWARAIRFDFQLHNFCDTIEHWLLDLRLLPELAGGPAASPAVDPKSTPLNASQAALLLDRIHAERLEGCTILHLASLSGNLATVSVAHMIWESGMYELAVLTYTAASRHPADEGLARRLEELKDALVK
jgi:hypothetical protein